MSDPTVLLMNPRRRKRRKHRSRKYSANPRRRRRHTSGRRRRYARNPKFSIRGVTGLALPALTGAAGAVGLDILMGYLPVPDSVKNNKALNVGAKALGAVALGWGAGKVAGKRTGVLFTAGALTVIAYQLLYGFAKDNLGDKVKGLSGPADFVDYSRVPVGAYMDQSLPAPAPAPTAMGYYNPAAIVSDGNMGAYMNDMGM